MPCVIIDNISMFDSCACLSGWTGDGQICGDVDECGYNECHINAQCINHPGSFECQCLPDFEGNGVTECRSGLYNL